MGVLVARPDPKHRTQSVPPALNVVTISDRVPFAHVGALAYSLD
jgi:hypothetical protein